MSDQTSIGLANSRDGISFDKNVVRSPLFPQSNTLVPQLGRNIKGLDQATYVRAGDYNYLYFGFRKHRDDRKPSVARVRHDQMDRRAAWRKFYDGAFRPLSHAEGDYQAVDTLNPDVADTNYHGVSPGFDDRDGLFYLIGPKNDGVYVSLSHNGSTFYRVPAPLLPYTPRNSGQADRERVGNVSIVGPRGGNHFDGGWFYVFYRFERCKKERPADGGPFCEEDGRNFVFRKVWFRRRRGNEPTASVFLWRYHDSQSQRSWTTSKTLSSRFRRARKLGRVLTAPVTGSWKLIDCARTVASGDERHLVRFNRDSCEEGERLAGVLGWAYRSDFEARPPGTRPLWRCKNDDPALRGTIIGDDADCPVPEARRSLGHILSTSTF